MRILIEGEAPGAVRIKSDHEYDDTIDFLIQLLETLLPEPGVPDLDDAPAGPGDTVN